MNKFLLTTGIVALLMTGNAHAQCNTLFSEGFESGSYTPTWAVGSAPITWAVTTTNPYAGTYRLEGTGGNSTHLTGLSTTLASSTPSEISWYINPSGPGASNYVLLGDNAITATNCVAFCYWQGGTNIRFVSGVTAVYNCTPGVWHHVEMRNINWTAHTFDIYINNTLVYATFPFRGAGVNSLTRIHLYNFSPGTTGAWDDIRVGGAPVTASSFSSGVACNGGSNGSATTTAAGGDGVYTYNWLPSGGTAAVATGLTAGTYSCIVSDGLGCLDTTTVTVTEPTAITSSLMQTNVSCNGGSNGDAMVTTAGGNPGYTYSWSPSGGTASMESGLIAGSYTCSITDANGCVVTETFVITEPMVLVVAAANNGNVCPGDSATLIGTATGGTANYTYDWMPGNLSGSVVQDNPSAPTTYTLLVTDANGCTDTSTTTVLINTPPTVSLGPDTTVCLGLFLNAQNPGSTYLWNDNSTQQMLGVTATGTFYVTVTDINGCSSSDTVNVTVDTQPNGGIISSSGGVDVCPGDSVFLSSVGDAGALNWWVMLVAAPFWQNVGSGNPFTHGPVTMADTGTYQFMAIASNGVCPDDTSNVITVIVHVPPVVNLSDTMACTGVVLDVTTVGATYLWSDSTTQQQISVSTSGVYSVVVTDQFGCRTSDTANVTITGLPGVGGSASSNSVCQDDANVVLTGTPASGTWSGPGVSGNTFDPSIGTGPQMATYAYTDTNGCTNYAVVTIAVNACVGIEEQTVNEINVYPNPNNGTFNVVLNSASDNLTVEITDLQGRVVLVSSIQNVTAGNTLQIDLTNEAAGTYFMRAITDTEQITQKIIINR